LKNIYSKERWKEFFISNAQDATCQRIFVSDFGRVRIKDIINNTFCFAKTSQRNGFLVFTYLDTGGNPKEYAIHRAVALTFLKNIDQSHTFVIHKDLNKHNNYYKNLKFVDYKGLQKHHQKAKDFFDKTKLRDANTKLTFEQVKSIKKRLNADASFGTLTVLANEYNISLTQITRIKLGENWRHVKINNSDD